MTCRMSLIRIEIEPGTTISEAVAAANRLIAKYRCRVSFEFNGANFVCGPQNNADWVLKDFNEKQFKSYMNR